MKYLVMLCGVYLVVETIISLWWKNNDKEWWCQLIRVSGIIVGIFIIWAGYLIG
jgi:hypothetical protein